MTNKEAIEILENLKMQGNSFYSQRLALDLAIKALEDRPQGEWIPVSERLPKIDAEKGRFECCMKIKDLISMLLEYDMNEKVTIYTPDEDNIVIRITDMSYKEEENE